MADLSNVPAIIQTGKTLFEIIINIGNNEIVTGIATIMGLSGFSLRDLIGKKLFSNLFHKIKVHFKGKETTEKQEKILRDCFLELEDYIKNCEELDENVFEHISDVLINGIDNEDILTREYIKILKKMSWIDLIVLINMDIIKEIRTADRIRYVEDMQKEYFSIFTTQHRDIPYELVQESLEKLKKMNLINNIGVSYKETLSNLSTVHKIHLRSSLGDKIVNLINSNNE